MKNFTIPDGMTTHAKTKTFKTGKSLALAMLFLLFSFGAMANPTDPPKGDRSETFQYAQRLKPKCGQQLACH